MKNILRSINRKYQKYFSNFGLFKIKINKIINSILFRNLIKLNNVFEKDFLDLKNNFKHNQISCFIKSLDQLEKNGYTIMNLSDFNLRKDLSIKKFLIELSKNYEHMSYEEVKNENLKQFKTKSYWKELYKSNFNYQKHNFEDPIQDLILNEALNKIAFKYLKRQFFVQEINFYFSPKRKIKARNNALIGSQGWHLDLNWDSQLKIFYSPFSMNSDCGPTTIYPAQLSSKLEYPNYPGYFNDLEAKEAGFDFKNVISMSTSPEEIFIADTSRCFHYGSRNAIKNRFLLIISLAPIPYNLSPYFIRKNLKSDFNFEYLNTEIRKNNIFGQQKLKKNLFF